MSKRTRADIDCPLLKQLAEESSFQKRIRIVSENTVLGPMIVAEDDEDELCELFTKAVSLRRPSVYGTPCSTVRSDDGQSFRYLFSRFEISIQLSNGEVHICFDGKEWTIKGSNLQRNMNLRIVLNDESNANCSLRDFFTLIKRPSWTRRYQLPKSGDSSEIFYASLSRSDICYLVYQLLPLTVGQSILREKDGSSQTLSDHLIETWLIPSIDLKA